MSNYPAGAEPYLARLDAQAERYMQFEDMAIRRIIAEMADPKWDMGNRLADDVDNGTNVTGNFLRILATHYDSLPAHIKAAMEDWVVGTGPDELERVANELMESGQ